MAVERNVDRLRREIRQRTRPGGNRGGGMNPANWWRWLYTGDARASDYVYAEALKAAGNVVNCWCDCEVQIHKSLAGQLGLASSAATGAGTVLTFTHWEIRKPSDILARTPFGDKTTIQKLVAQRLRDAMESIDKLPAPERSRITALRRRTYDRIAARLMDAGTRVSLRPRIAAAKSVARGSMAGTALVEAGFSIYCGWKCR